MRGIVTAILRLVIRLFFRRIEIAGAGQLPLRSPVVFAVNHPNGLVDPLFLLCFTPRRVSFLAKAPLFSMPLIGQFARALDTIPVYRKSDNFPAERNRETFARAREVLGRGGAIAIFPEGTTHSGPHLLELKSGAARIALGAGVSPLIVPVILYYTEKKTFRSDALVVFGAPLEVTPQALDQNGEPPRAAVEELTAVIDDALTRLGLEADSHEALDLIARSERIFSGGRSNRRLIDELTMRKRFIAGYARLRESDPGMLALFESDLRRFECELSAAGLDAAALDGQAAGRWPFTLLLAPLAIAGTLIHYPLYRLTDSLANRLSRGEHELAATIKLVAAMVFFPLLWSVSAFLAGREWGLAAGLWILLLLPLSGWAAVRFGEVVAVLRSLFHSRGPRLAVLKEQREELRRRLVAIAAGIERDR